MSKIYGLPAMAVVCALGGDKREVWTNWLAGKRDTSTLSDAYIPDHTVRVGAVKGPLPSCDKRWPYLVSRNIQLLEAAFQQIEQDVSLLLTQYQPSRVAIVLGTSTSGVAEGEYAIAERENSEFPESFHYAQQEMGSPAVYLKKKLGLTGPAYCISTACSSSAKVFNSARNLLASGMADAVILGGVDSICKLTLNGFFALESVASDEAQPFGEHRDGINIGEGAALFIMTNEAAEVNLLGVGESSDAYHMSAPHPEGLGAEAAICAALEQACIEPSQVAYINLHGTATPLNDKMEALAVERVFGDNTLCSSTKHQTGHTLGAAGAIENALCWLLLHPAFNCNAEIPGMNADYALDPELPNINLLFGPRAYPYHHKLGSTLSHSFAFGGSNAVVCLGHKDVFND
ncbi:MULTISPECIES: beta-ketoacyl-ACP synthase [unclassified Agarivorans]|uniref:beta-ketoacyl-ACP synthase n=1 Tax=unclassified Agarivorans TaxID=2636026 RepID=UPI0026E2A153|nr:MULTISPECIES: beta-ketoacyl-ACP synthase [unclassified Agarivorans]MDO6685287.1 beta-ketoacyl-ACP synthase [Agarivorans sp. 3_MG-2023]MDO6715541.1 beta-ketoacyl-ACP synthase [Agarivorans sp. 2_MG-2023]